MKYIVLLFLGFYSNAQVVKDPKEVEYYGCVVRAIYSEIPAHEDCIDYVIRKNEGKEAHGDYTGCFKSTTLSLKAQIKNCEWYLK